MSEVERTVEGDISLLSVGTTVLRNRWRIARWMLAGGLIALAAVITQPSLYKASASFVPQGSDQSRSGLASMAGQFGVSLPNTNQSQSPDFYAQLLKSRVLLQPIGRDTLVVPELGNKRVTILELFGITGGTAKYREEQGVKLLTGIVSTSISRTTGLVEISVATKWPGVSLAIVTSIVQGVGEYNQRTRQSQVSAERRFVEGRLAIATTELRDAEDRLEEFERTNRQIGSSPELIFQRERLQRDVSLRQQVFMTLTQANEDVRIREVHDTPVITIFEPPSVPTLPEPRGRLRTIILGILLGGIIGAMLGFASGTFARLRQERSVEADEFVGTLSELKREVSGRMRWLKKGVRR